MEPETWNRQASAPREADGGDWIKKVRGVAKEHICIPQAYPMDTDNRLVMVKRGGCGCAWRWAKGDTCNNVNIKNF